MHYYFYFAGVPVWILMCPVFYAKLFTSEGAGSRGAWGTLRCIIIHINMLTFKHYILYEVTIEKLN